MPSIKILQIYKELVIGELPYPGYSLEAVRKQLVLIRNDNKIEQMTFFIDTREVSPK
jgi:hypothetical protein